MKKAVLAGGRRRVRETWGRRRPLATPPRGTTGRSGASERARLTMVKDPGTQRTRGPGDGSLRPREAYVNRAYPRGYHPGVPALPSGQGDPDDGRRDAHAHAGFGVSGPGRAASTGEGGRAWAATWGRSAPERAFRAGGATTEEPQGLAHPRPGQPTMPSIPTAATRQGGCRPPHPPLGGSPAAGNLAHRGRHGFGAGLDARRGTGLGRPKKRFGALIVDRPTPAQTRSKAGTGDLVNRDQPGRGSGF